VGAEVRWVLEDGDLHDDELVIGEHHELLAGETAAGRVAGQVDEELVAHGLVEVGLAHRDVAEPGQVVQQQAHVVR
jgi:hypothetical protein